MNSLPILANNVSNLAFSNAVYHEGCHNGPVLPGAVGWTEEMDIGRYHIRTKADRFDEGLSDLHLERIDGSTGHKGAGIPETIKHEDK